MNAIPFRVYETIAEVIPPILDNDGDIGPYDDDGDVNDCPGHAFV